MNFQLLFCMVLQLFACVTEATINKLTVSISEDSPVNVSIVYLKTKVEQVQSNFNFEQNFQLSQNKYFYLTKNWDLIVLTNLDRDRNSDLCKEMTTEFLCVWTGVIMFDSAADIISLRVEIKDINDNSPSWSQPIFIEILENNDPGKTIDLPQAQDYDSPPNNIQKYHFLTNEYSSLFRLTCEPSPSGIIPKLIIETSLDYEENQEFSLTLCATDGVTEPFHEGFVNLTLKILDQNDNSPKFSKTHFSLTLPENFGLHKPLPLNINVTDKDLGLFGTIVYQISDSSPAESLKKFAISDKGIISLIRNLDYDIGEKYFKFFVIAKDRGNPPLSASATVEIHVKDVNDQPPAIMVNPYLKTDSKNNHLSVSIVENNLYEVAVARITATDSDSFENDYCNCTLTHFIDFKLVFERNVQKMTIYKLLANKVFDREAVSIIRTTVVCSDSGSPPMTSSETLDIYIEDVNDNSPVFKRNLYSFVVSFVYLYYLLDQKYLTCEILMKNNLKITKTRKCVSANIIRVH